MRGKGALGEAPCRTRALFGQGLEVDFHQALNRQNVGAHGAAQRFFGNALMSKCAEVWVFGSRISSGMETEIKRAKWKDYRLRYFTEECQEV